MKKWMPAAAAIVAALAVLLLVPASPALLVDSPTVLFASGMDEWGMPSGLVATAYSLVLAVGAALALPLTHFLFKKKTGNDKGVGLALVSGVCALCVSHWMFCALRWGYIINDLMASPAFVVQFWQGGYTMYGAILGGILGAFLFAKGTKQSVAATMDAVFPGMALMVALGRFAEMFTSQGMGSYVANEALSMLPFVRMNEWGESQVMVYVYEGLAAVAALAAMLVILRGGKAKCGTAAETGLTIVSAAQVLLDSWRGDELIRFGFVRLNMICAAVTLACLMALKVYRAVKAQGVKPWTIIRVVMLLAGAATVLIVEFGLDGKMGIMMNNTILYGIQTAAVVLMGAVTLIDAKAVKA